MEREKNAHRKWQGVDKDPTEERKRGEKVGPNDLKGKKVDADPSRKGDRPFERNSNPEKRKKD
jgi:hypothetical protein